MLMGSGGSSNVRRDVGGYCRKCRKFKPPRAHHCHICKTCVLKMDHHCPWVHNCIGYYNYRYFWLFLCYMWLGCVYSVLLTAFPFYKAISSKTRPRGEEEHNSRKMIVFVFVLCLSVGIAITILFGWHVYLLLTAQTTIDFYINRTKEWKLRKQGKVSIDLLTSHPPRAPAFFISPCACRNL